MSNKIIINATALDSSGALTILKQFIESIPDDEYEYILFVNDVVQLNKTNNNITFIQKNVKSFIKRFYWDVWGANNWLKTNKIIPLATISLQNTNFRTNKSIPNYIYYHQPIPLFLHKWNPIKKEERTLWFYKKIYPYFVKLFINNNTEIFVQINAIKDGFAKRYNFSKDKIHVISPNIELPSIQDADSPVIDKNQLNLFYPATPFIYKNHEVILKALSLLEPELQRRITLHLTFEKFGLKSLNNEKQSSFQINYMGKVAYYKVLEMYSNADALLFPSFIETFGLPLIEAASYGLPIIASDLPYSHEVLNNYKGVRFAPYNNANLWKEEISQLFSLKGQRFDPITIDKSNSWQELFRIMKNKIQHYV